jgi:hypothetical protein
MQYKQHNYEHLRRLFAKGKLFTGGAGNVTRRVIRQEVHNEVDYVVYEWAKGKRNAQGRVTRTPDGYYRCTLEQFYKWAYAYLKAEQQVEAPRVTRQRYW